jgi:DNA-binding LytR/AlgR family response regulator
MTKGSDGLRVYILDRHDQNREQLLEWLSEDKRLTGIEVFEDYIELIEQIGITPPDFCFIRLGRDGIPGLKTADMIRQTSSDIQIIFISDDRDYAMDAFEVGAYGYLLCPVERDRLKKYLMMKKEALNLCME